MVQSSFKEEIVSVENIIEQIVNKSNNNFNNLGTNALMSLNQSLVVNTIKGENNYHSPQLNQQPSVNSDIEQMLLHD